MEESQLPGRTRIVLFTLTCIDPSTRSSPASRIGTRGLITGCSYPTLPDVCWPKPAKTVNQYLATKPSQPAEMQAWSTLQIPALSGGATPHDSQRTEALLAAVMKPKLGLQRKVKSSI
jgi:hypothetical protein